MSTSRSRKELEASRQRYEELTRQPLPAPGNIRSSSPEVVAQLQRLGHPAELITAEELPAALDRARDPDENKSFR
jgi:hypothetical protein